MFSVLDFVTFKSNCLTKYCFLLREEKTRQLFRLILLFTLQ